MCLLSDASWETVSGNYFSLDYEAEKQSKRLKKTLPSVLLLAEAKLRQQLKAII